MTPQQIAASAAHSVLSQLIAAGISPPDTEIKHVAHDPATEWKVIISLVRSAPMQVYLNPGVDPGKIPGAISPPLFANQEPPLEPVYVLREIEKNILEASPAISQEPVSMKKLSRTAGYGYNWHFRASVNRLVELKLLARTSKGVRRTV